MKSREFELTDLFISQVTGAVSHGQAPKEPFSAVTTDSRKAKPGQLFVALKGEDKDGHDYVGSALAQGASGALVSDEQFKKNPDWAKSARIYAAPDSLEAFRMLAAAWREKFEIPVLLIAGSAGKTTTKEFLAALLEGHYPSQVLKTVGSQNGFIGIPITLMDLRASHRAAVIEVGIDEIGAMAKHLPIVKPTAALLTSIGPEHLEKLVDVETVAREEMIALEWVAKNGGTVAVNLDDPWIAKGAPKTKRLTFSLKDAKADFFGKSGVGMLEISGALKTTLPLELPGPHNALNLLGAVVLAHSLGLTETEIKNGLSRFSSAEGRSQLRKLKDGSPILCDYYNAQPLSVAAALSVLSEIKAPARWACLGDMLELGTGEEKLHRELAPAVIASKAQQIFLFGKRMRWLKAELESKGFKGKLVHSEDKPELIKTFLAQIRPGDAGLIKGSRGMKMEELWKALEAKVGLA